MFVGIVALHCAVLTMEPDVDMEETAEAAILRGTTNQHGYLQVFQHIGK